MRTIAALTVGLLLLSGCTGEPEVREPDPSTSASTEAPPSMPAQAKEDTDEGKIAFVVHWIDLFNHASATGDVAELSERSESSCEGCSEYIDLYETTYASGGYYRGGDWTVTDTAIDKQSDEIFIRFEAGATTYKSSKTTEKRESAPEDTTLLFQISDDPSDRRVTSLERVQP